MTDGREGRVVQARSVEALMRAIEESYRDQASARAMGMAGRALVENKYNWSNYASSLVEIYRTLLTEQVKTGRGGVM
jgi:glycosyltransferase involved in cell wall biosynthesis